MGVVRGMLLTWPGRLFALALIGVIVGGAVFVSRANAPAAKQELRTQPVTKGTVTQSVAISGSVASSSQAKLTFQKTGKVTAVYVSVGQQVSAGQALAKVDSTDLENALAQAQSSLRSAQVSYDRAVASANDAQRSLEQTQQSTQTDIANAEQAVTKLKANYVTAKNAALSAATTIYTDIGSFQSGLDTLKTDIDIESNDLAQAQRDPAVGLNAQSDVKNAQNAINGGYGPLSSAQSLTASVLKPAIDEWQRGIDGIGASIARFDSALASGSDTTAASADFQQSMLSYNLASQKLTSAIDSVTSPLSSIASNVTTAQASLNTTNTRTMTALDRSRTDLATLLTAVTAEPQLASSTKTKLSQAGTSLSTVNDAIGGSIVNAMQNVDATIQRSAQSVQSAQTNVAQQPFNLANAKASVDNAATNVQTAQANLDTATLYAPSSGIIASIASAVGESAASPVMVLTGSSALTLHGTIGEADVAKLKVGQVANVTVDAVGTSARMTGKVTSVDPTATIQQGVPVYGVDVTIDLPNQQVRPGMSGTANVVIASRQGVLTVPNLAIRTTSGKRYVQVLKDGEAVDTDVTFGIANDTVTEVTAGLAEGDLVVLPQSRTTSTPRPGGGFGGGGGPVIVGR
ncbi:MAG: efflux RND transporter periplasmic adaptor subunit [Chloroflexi bacterium]|nr:MAG: efflux RND transporter periplasmic adaptor subunit [Chloroflexota bacterium]